MPAVRRIDRGPEPGSGYTSTFALSPAPPRPARDWAVSVFGDAPAAFRLALRLGWRLGLQLRLDGESSALGWRVDAPDDTQATLAAAGPLLEARNVVDVAGDELRWTTIVVYRSAVGRAVWSAAARLHHLTLPWLLRRAARAH